jgi:hypothetical protein
LDRCLFAELEKGIGSQNVKKMNFEEMKNETEGRMLEILSSELPIRGLRVEEKKRISSMPRPKHRRGSKGVEATSQVCSCLII